MRSLDSTSASHDFPAQVERCAHDVRRSLSEVIAHVPDLVYRKPNDLAVRLALDPKLAWNVGRCTESTDLFAAAHFVPGPTGVRTFLRAAKRAGVAPILLKNAQRAFENFNRLVRQHAGSRKHFNLLLAPYMQIDHTRAEIEHRRLLFEGSTYVWGLLARTTFRTIIMHPGCDPCHLDAVTMRGFIDFRRTRPGVLWRLHSSVSVDREHRVHTEVTGRPLDPRVDEHDAPLLLDFCTKPIPDFRPVVSPCGAPEFEFSDDTVGNASRMACVVGEVLPAVEPCYQTDAYDEFSATFNLHTPAENAVFDVFIHRNLFRDVEPMRAELYSDLFGGGPTVRYEPSDRLPLHEQVACLGYGVDVAALSEIPRYSEMLRYALEQMSWEARDFELHRLHMRYPPIATTLMLRRALPAP